MMRFVDVDHPHPYPPRRSQFTSTFWEALAQGRFLATRPSGGGTIFFPPRDFNPVDMSRDIQWVELSGRGSLYSVTSIHAAPEAFQALIPYQVCIVDLVEGPRIATLFLGPVDTPLDTETELVVIRYSDGVGFAAAPLNGSVQ